MSGACRADEPPGLRQPRSAQSNMAVKTRAPDDGLDEFLPEQVFTMRRGKTQPMRRLMTAVLRDAIGCFQRYLLDPTHRGQRLFRDAEQWIMAESDVTPLRFPDVCDLLGLEPDYLRSRLREWQARQLTRSYVGPSGVVLTRL